jgi:hypothetical protein
MNGSVWHYEDASSEDNAALDTHPKTAVLLADMACSRGYGFLQRAYALSMMLKMVSLRDENPW